ncbi:hypothetical protein [Tannockella kyphosi]|uniref:hypothetical protein n=1 Tax=Tannockella kyphosi TaxID=2899121 RepID=UPI002011AD22|nr:hypothetical protein [Tannockella kyphosi]
MKHKKVCLSVIVTMILLVITSTSSFGLTSTPEVIFDTSSGMFSYNNAKVSSSTGCPDLFTDIKGVIPGDSLEQVIELTVENIGDETVYIYLRSKGESEDYTTLMENVLFTVSYDDQEITGLLEDGVMLGVFSENKTTEITIVLEISMDVGNEIASLQGEIDWVFVAEIIEDTEEIVPISENGSEEETIITSEDESDEEISSILDILETGDNTNITILVLFLATSVITIIIFAKKESKEKQK